MKPSRLIIFLPLLAMACISQNQNETAPVEDPDIRIAFYNVENLFDTKDDPATEDEEFLPAGPKQWTEERYQQKLKNLAAVVAGLDYPEMIGLAEIENQQVLQDLVDHETLANYSYDIVHFDSPDARGIDVALLYRSTFFSPFLTQAFKVTFDSGDYQTRDILEVSGILGEDKEEGINTLTVLVNHWPSRRGGMAASESRRIAAATRARALVDELLTVDPNANIILMGDFNDEPDNRSILTTLEAKGDPAVLDDNDLFNPMYALKEQGKGSYLFRGQWDMLDQIMLSQALFKAEKNKSDFHYKEGSATIFSQEWLLQQEGKYQGYPLRTYGGNEYLGGYSDHLPVYIELEATK